MNVLITILLLMLATGSQASNKTHPNSKPRRDQDQETSNVMEPMIGTLLPMLVPLATARHRPPHEQLIYASTVFYFAAFSNSFMLKRQKPHSLSRAVMMSAFLSGLAVLGQQLEIGLYGRTAHLIAILSSPFNMMDLADVVLACVNVLTPSFDGNGLPLGIYAFLMILIRLIYPAHGYH